jgi:hypothetical protein
VASASGVAVVVSSLIRVARVAAAVKLPSSPGCAVAVMPSVLATSAPRLQAAGRRLLRWLVQTSFMASCCNGLIPGMQL